MRPRQRAAAAPIFLLACLSAAQGAIIRGRVIEKRSGYSLSRATVTLQSVNAGLPIRTARTSESGTFEFPDLGPGDYLLRASRRGFMPMQYGQKRWNSAGAAVKVAADDVLFLEFPLARYGAITGTVRDGNEVGIPDQDVAVWTNTQPPQFITLAKTDDRGVFRIGGLEPGAYLVRTTGNYDGELSYLPTFSRQSLRVEEARPVIVYPDEDSGDGDIRPLTGRLFDLTGSAAVPSLPAFAVTVTLASDMGRVTSQGPVFRFAALAPGRYEIYAEARENPPGTRLLGGYTEVLIERNLTNFALPMNDVRDTQFTLEGAGPDAKAASLVRRKDLAGTGATQPIALTAASRVALFPGRWEVMVTPPDGYYVSRFSPARTGNQRPEGWNDVLVNGFLSRLAIGLANGPGGIHGVVKTSSGPAEAAPVFLEAWDPLTRTRLLDLRETRTDSRGNYRFVNLAPGDYRILATFEYAAPDSGAFDAAGARSIRIESSTNPQVDLDLYGIQ